MSAPDGEVSRNLSLGRLACAARSNLEVVRNAQPLVSPSGVAVVHDGGRACSRDCTQPARPAPNPSRRAKHLSASACSISGSGPALTSWAMRCEGISQNSSSPERSASAEKFGANGIRTIQVLLGHSNISTTTLYAHVSADLITATTSPLERLRELSKTSS